VSKCVQSSGDNDHKQLATPRKDIFFIYNGIFVPILKNSYIAQPKDCVIYIYKVVQI
jgi:hypothetical protein